MEGYQAYRVYLGVRQHFVSETFDFAEKGHVRAARSTFDDRKDKWAFERVARVLTDAEVIQFFVSNLLDDPKVWIGDLAGPDNLGFEIFRAWQKRIGDLPTQVSFDIANVTRYAQERDIADYLAPHRSGWPLLFRAWRQKMVCPETVVWAELEHHFVSKLDFRHDPVWTEATRRLHKYSRLLEAVDWKAVSAAVSSLIIPARKADMDARPTGHHKEGDTNVTGKHARPAQAEDAGALAQDPVR